MAKFKSREYLDLVKSIGECKSKIEEDAIMKNEVRLAAFNNTHPTSEHACERQKALPPPPRLAHARGSEEAIRLPLLDCSPAMSVAQGAALLRARHAKATAQNTDSLLVRFVFSSHSFSLRTGGLLEEAAKRPQAG